jgi:hypothetical protein
MIKGLSITPPILGRISIGRVVEKEGGKRLPQKDDQFTITTLVQQSNHWLLHRLDSELRVSAEEKLRSIPVRFLFSDPDLNLRAEYSLFDRTTGRPVCVGNGESCKRMTANGLESLPCPSPSQCEWGSRAGCKPYGRLNVQIDNQHDALGSFIFRTTGFNSIRTLSARLHYFRAVSGDLLAAMPLRMSLRAKTTTMSHRTPVYYVDLTLRPDTTLEQTIEQARTLDQQRREAGFHQQALDDAARMGFNNGLFEDTEDEISDVIEEFYPEQSEQSLVDQPTVQKGLTDKLAHRVYQQTAKAANSMRTASPAQAIH